MSDNKIEISGSYVIKMFLIVGGVLGILYIGSSLFLPLIVAAFMALLLDKPTQKMKQWGVPKWLAITLSIIIMVVVFSLLSWLIVSQINIILDDWPNIKEKATEKLNSFSEFANQSLNWDYEDYIENNKRLVDRMESVAGFFISSFMNLMSQLLIIFIYIILLLMQRNMFIKFFKKLSSNKAAMSSLLSDAAHVVNRYFIGKSKIMMFLFVIYYIGFLLGSVRYALFLALFAALFSIIPYIGNIIGGGIAVILSYLYVGATPALIVIGVISATQLLENYILTPWIIGDEISLNPLITIFSILLFTLLWGTVGAIIALPIVGVLKVFFEHTKGMEAFAYLLNNRK